MADAAPQRAACVTGVSRGLGGQGDGRHRRVLRGEGGPGDVERGSLQSPEATARRIIERAVLGEQKSRAVLRYLEL